MQGSKDCWVLPLKPGGGFGQILQMARRSVFASPHHSFAGLPDCDSWRDLVWMVAVRGDRPTAGCSRPDDVALDIDTIKRRAL